MKQWLKTSDKEGNVIEYNPKVVYVFNKEELIELNNNLWK